MENNITDNKIGPVDYLIQNKSLWLGLAIILIILYHMPRVLPLLNIFNPGFIGVDFFLFFSGFSLCYSYEKNNLDVFYKRRFLRIYPMYFILATVISILPICSGGGISLLSWLCNISTLSYYKIGGVFVDWYLSSIFLFYLLFPLFYLLTKKLKWLIPTSVSLLLLIILSVYDIHWWYGCAIGRLPIYCLGIICFLDKSDGKLVFRRCCWFYLLLFLIAVLSYKMGYYMRGYFFTDMITPILLLSVSFLLSKNSKNNDYKDRKPLKLISFLGDYTLEIYVANVITMRVVNILYSSYNSVLLIAIYLLFNTVIAFVLVKINAFIKKSSNA